MGIYGKPVRVMGNLGERNQHVREGFTEGVAFGLVLQGCIGVCWGNCSEKVGEGRGLEEVIPGRWGDKMWKMSLVGASWSGHLFSSVDTLPSFTPYP